MSEGEGRRNQGLIGGLVGRAAPLVIRNIDMDAVVDALDVDAIAAELDLDALIQRLDVDAVAARLDLDALIQRLDVAGLAAGATTGAAVSGLDLVRRQLVRADRTVEVGVDRVLRRSPDGRPDAPPRLIDESGPGVLETVEAEAPVSGRRAVSGHYAGPVTRLLALAGDTFGSLAAWGLIGSTVASLLRIIFGAEVTLGDDRWLSAVLLAAWTLLWFWIPVVLFGRTAAMALVGLGVVRRDGSLVSSSRAFVRALVVPLSVSAAALGLIGIFIGRERRALHDVAAGTVVVYDWGSREAEQPAGIRELLSARVHRRAARV